MELYVIIGIVVIVAVVLALLYNRLVGLRNAYKNAYAQIDVQLKRRHDLIPMLIDAVKGYMTHERETLESVIQARNTAETARQNASTGDAAAMGKLNQAEGALGSVLGRLFALSEAYPDLKASQNFMQYQEELSSTENRVAYARQAYNDGVNDYNNAVESVPTNLIAGMFGFKAASLLEFADREAIQDMPSASFT